MSLRKSVGFVVAVIGVTTFVGPAFAAGLSDQFSSCVTKFANDKQSVSVMLECNAADGKLSDCKVTDAPSPANGFDKAALCVADVLPIGSKTGTVKVPIRFQGNT
ncbi:MAG: hypothetical protein ACLQUZ_00150 [Rhizomicrobium sp.]